MVAGNTPSAVPISVRPGGPEDAGTCGRICYEAFGSIAARHGFPSDFPSLDGSATRVGRLLSHPGFAALVAEIAGRPAGCAFLDLRSTIAGIGPVAVDPPAQDRGVGRRLMEAALDRAASHPGVRLLQSAYHGRSLALYTNLGFEVREPVACLQGTTIGQPQPGCAIRAVEESDLYACNRLCAAVHGHDRGGELLDAVRQGTARLVEREGRVTGYATGFAFFAHAVGEADQDLMALVGSAPAFGGSGILVPIRNAALFQWCLEHRLRIVQVMILMAKGFYREPAGAWMPSVLY